MDRSPPSPRRPLRLGRSLLLVLAVVLAWRFRGDVTNSHIAYGIYCGNQGNQAAAEQAFAASRAWQPDPVAAGQARLRYYQQQHNWEAALREAEGLVQELPRQPLLRLNVSEMHLHLQQNERALQVAEEAVDIAREELAMAQEERSAEGLVQASLQYAEVLNGLAYTRARTRQGLEQGRQEIDLALALQPARKPLPDHMLDTRGYLAFLQGDLATALHDMERCVRRFRELYQQELVNLRWERRSWVDPSRVDEQLQRSQHNLAVGYQHLGLVRRALGQTVRAADDLARATALGYDPAAGVW